MSIITETLQYVETKKWPILLLHGITDGKCDCSKEYCSSPGKHPIASNGVYSATRSIKDLEIQFKNNPNANIGLPTGQTSGIVVIDVDGTKGISNLHHLMLGKEDQFKTSISLTGKGYHYFFQCPEEGLHNSASLLGSGIDVRGDGGYVVLPPSKHILGNYTWLSDDEILPFPPFLLDKLKKKNIILNEKNDIKESFIEGERNNVLTSIAGKLRRIGFSTVEIRNALIGVNLNRCIPPLEQDELHIIANSIGKYEGGKLSEKVSKIKKMDWSIPPKSPEWFLEGLVAKGDIVLLMGEPEAQKSWFAMALATAVARGDKEFLGMKLDSTGPVMYVDEENYSSEIWRRLQRLGFDPAQHGQNLCYYYQQQLRLNHNPDRLLSEIEKVKPCLVILDSLIRFHTEDEQSNTAMARLWNNGIEPISRQFNCTTLVLHHVVKAAEYNSRRRARGAGDIIAAIDIGLDIFIPDLGAYRRVKVFKPRHLVDFNTFYFKVLDKDSSTILERCFIEGVENILF